MKYALVLAALLASTSAFAQQPNQAQPQPNPTPPTQAQPQQAPPTGQNQPAQQSPARAQHTQGIQMIEQGLNLLRQAQPQ